MSLVLDGSVGITYPAGSNAQGAPSKVLQVIQSTYNTETSTTSGSYVTTGLSVSITPLFSTSKILILSSLPVSTSASGIAGIYSIFRNSTNLVSSGSQTSLSELYSGAGSLFGCVAINYLDSPATTSSTTYAVYMYTTGTTKAQVNGQTSTITVMEIAQ